MYPAQSAEGLEVRRIAAHGQIIAFHQRQSELPRQVGMLEIGFIERARSQHHGQRCFAVGTWPQQILA